LAAARIAEGNACGKTGTRWLIARFGVLAMLASTSMTAWSAPAAAPTTDRPEQGRTERELYDPMKAGPLAANLLLALHHANVTGNYSVLRDLAAPQLISRMTQADLSDHFRQVRIERLGLDAIAGHRPHFSTPPTIVGKRYLWLEGSFPTRPKEIRFKIILQRSRADWRFLSVEAAAAEPSHATVSGSHEAPGPRNADVSNSHAMEDGAAAGPRLRGSVVQE
jgi:hypothetical protein